MNDLFAATAAEGEDATRPESVSAFTRRVKALLERGLGPRWVRGEVSGLRVQASGHSYFALKDAGAQVRAVLFRGDAARQGARLREGGQVVVLGEPSVYEARGEYQLVVRAVQDDGIGRLQREFEALKARLAAEGLFEKARKRTPPRLPRTVGFVTSPTGAAAQDFLRILSRRGWRGRVVILPAKVQGEGAAAEIADMIRLAGDPVACGIPFDLLVVGRGGGSIEDLWAFNEEATARAVARSTVPVISAVGHEIDFTLCDFAADIRAETPSAAAELITSGYVAEKERLERLARSLNEELAAAINAARERSQGLAARLRLLSPAARLENGWLRLDDLQNRLGAAAEARLDHARHRLALASAAYASARPERRLESERQRLRALDLRLQSVSPASVLKRGFAILRDADGRPLAGAAAARAASRVRAQFADGEVTLRPEREPPA